VAFHLLLGPVYDDKDVQECIVRRSKLDCVIVRPVVLTNGGQRLVVKEHRRRGDSPDHRREQRDRP
jgi:hypothetical protein